MSVKARPPNAQAAQHVTPYLIVVARERPDLWHDLPRHFADYAGVEIVPDRRRGERRQQTGAPQMERRRTDRRRSVCPELDLKGRTILIVAREGGPFYVS
ncbi:MAG TPA: hypothetical protein VN648_30520 [Candidatus Methylomirabilis sp.]|nr:hypothetical protein [Candidatus Methylomirabilis sp.]